MPDQHDDGGFTGANTDRAAFQRLMVDVEAKRVDVIVAASRRKGKWTGGPVPFGYTVQERKLSVNDSEAAIVREAFRLHVQHGQMAPVAKELTARALLPRRPRVYKPNKSLRWTVDSIGRVLANPIYAGFITCGNDQVNGEHEAVVDLEIWQASQRLLHDRIRFRQSHGINHDYVLRGITRCGRCNAAMCPASTRKGSRVHRYYRCSTRDKTGRQYCDASPVAAAPLEEYVAARVAQVVADGDFVNSAFDATETLLEDRLALLETQRLGLNHRLAESSAHSGKLADEWVMFCGSSDLRPL